MKRVSVCIALLLATALLVPCAFASEEVTVNDLLDDMLKSYRTPSPQATGQIDRDVEALDDPVLRTVAESWKQLYLDPGFRILYMRRNDPAELNIPDPSKHAFVVLGYRLSYGEMEPELMGRCEAAAAAARAYPEAIIICTGGETGVGNRDHNTEAGKMAAYLIDKCGIDQARIHLDKDALTTAENAANSFRIMRENGIETMTIVTSGYHLRWASLLFSAVAAWNREKEGYPVETVGNWCYYTAPGPGYSNANEGLAISQLRDLLLYQENAYYADTLPEAE